MKTFTDVQYRPNLVRTTDVQMLLRRHRSAWSVDDHVFYINAKLAKLSGGS